jgi:hypothetical protein
MAESVAELLNKLRFVGRPVETLYLNEIRVRESFIGQLGAIESFTRTATKEGSVEAPVIKVGAALSSEANITWTLSDPITQVLVLRASLESQGLLYGFEGAEPGRYINIVGHGLASRPAMFDDYHRVLIGDNLYEGLEAERAKQESVARMIEGPEKSLWLLTVGEGSLFCVAFLDNSWLRPVFGHWANPGYARTRWEVFGLCRRINELGFPMLATLYAGVNSVHGPGSSELLSRRPPTLDGKSIDVRAGWRRPAQPRGMARLATPRASVGLAALFLCGAVTWGSIRAWPRLLSYDQCRRLIRRDIQPCPRPRHPFIDLLKRYSLLARRAHQCAGRRSQGSLFLYQRGVVTLILDAVYGGSRAS